MPILEIIRNVVVALTAVIGLYSFGPQIVDQYYLPTIGYVADSFLAVAPLPPPVTTSTRVQPPIAVARTAMMTKTIFVDEATFGTRPTPQGATITGIKQTQSDSSPRHDGFFHRFSFLREVSHTGLLALRQLLTNFSYQVAVFTTTFISWHLLKTCSLRNIKYVTRRYELEIAGINEQFSALDIAQNLKIASLEAQVGQLDETKSLLQEARRALEANQLAEGQSESEFAKLNSSLMDKDKTIAERDRSLAEAKKRAKVAEDSKKNLEKKVNEERSNFNSTSQKKENEIDAHKRAFQEVTEDSNSIRVELKDTRAQATKDKKRIAELEKQVANAARKASELEAQVKEKDTSINQKDESLAKMRDERKKMGKRITDTIAERDRAWRNGENAKAKEKKRIDGLQAQVTEANRLREAAETKALKQESLAAEVAKQLQLKEEKISSLKQDSKTSCGYLQRNLDAAGATNTGLLNTLGKEREDARKAAAKAQGTEEALQKRIVELEEQVQVTPSSPSIAARSSDASPLEPSSSPRPHPVPRFPGRRGPRHVSSANGERTAAPAEERGLPADTPTGPRSGRGGPGPGPRCVPPPNGQTKTRPEDRGLPADTPTGPKGARGARKN